MDQETATNVARRLIQAARVFAERNPYPEQAKQSWSVWWRWVPEAEELFRAAAEEVVQSNPSQLSYPDTAHSLTYGSDLSLWALGHADAPKETVLEADLCQQILGLANSRSTQSLQFIIENLVVDGEAPHFFSVELFSPTPEEMQRLYDDPLIPGPHTKAIVFANVNAPGDQTVAFEWGRRQVDRYLDLVTGCGSEFMLGTVYPVHILGRNPILDSTPYRLLGDHAPHTIVRSGHGSDRRHARLSADLLAPLAQTHLNRLLLATTDSCSPLLDSVVAGLETLGEACKPNLTSTRMLLASSALEMMLGAESSDMATFRSQTAAIAERAAFLIGGTTFPERLNVDRRVRDLYSKGSAVRHGRRPDITADDVGELAIIARRVALALLDRSDQIGDQDKLDIWVRQMRYTTGEEPESPT